MKERIWWVGRRGEQDRWGWRAGIRPLGPRNLLIVEGRASQTFFLSLVFRDSEYVSLYLSSLPLMTLSGFWKRSPWQLQEVIDLTYLIILPSTLILSFLPSWAGPRFCFGWWQPGARKRIPFKWKHSLSRRGQRSVPYLPWGTVVWSLPWSPILFLRRWFVAGFSVSAPLSGIYLVFKNTFIFLNLFFFYKKSLQRQYVKISPFAFCSFFKACKLEKQRKCKWVLNSGWAESIHPDCMEASVMWP